jgi:hypothetical protein
MVTLEDVVVKAMKVHGDKYTYVRLIREPEKPLVIECECKVHGLFSLRASRHYTEGAGCPGCSRDNQKLTLAEFTRRAVVMHNSKYTYDAVVYKGFHTKVAITCPIHGSFLQTPNAHIGVRADGCSLCGKVAAASKHSSSTSEFITRASKVHGNTYDYSKVAYTKANNKVDILCSICNTSFSQKASMHLRGQGCPVCGREKTTKAKQAAPDRNGWSYTNWKAAGEKSKNFDSYKLYIIECWEGGEVFIKVGKTFNTTTNRLRGKCMPYQWRLVKEVVGSALYISKLEESLHGVLKSIRLGYAPEVKFNGASECYNVSSLYTKVIADVT